MPKAQLISFEKELTPDEENIILFLTKRDFCQKTAPTLKGSQNFKNSRFQLDPTRLGFIEKISATKNDSFCLSSFHCNTRLF